VSLTVSFLLYIRMRQNCFSQPGVSSCKNCTVIPDLIFADALIVPTDSELVPKLGIVCGERQGASRRYFAVFSQTDTSG
jgi:hypothetical protein